MKRASLVIFLFSLFLLVIVGGVGATALTSTISMDNGYEAYLSTDDTLQGTQFASYNNWNTAHTATTTLLAGTDYYLHVYGYDEGGIAGFLGEFSLSGSDHTFSNDSTSLLTNTTYWSGNNTGWTDSMTTLTDLGQNGVDPWFDNYAPAIDSSARWIWAGDAEDNNIAYFTTTISAAATPVPEPSTFLLLGSGLAGLGLYARKRKKA